MRGPWNPNNEHRCYYMAHNVIYDMARDYFAEVEKPIVRIKGFYHDALSDEKAALSGRSPWFDQPQYYFPVCYTARGRNVKLHSWCENWFFKNCEPPIEGMFNCYGWKGIKDAIEATEDYQELIDVWDNYFERKRERFMKKQNKEIMVTSGKPAKMPTSHGGVANLLKTLTKTMIMQGSSVETIAKVQYAICKQAGIYIPDEFLTDVAVVIDYKNQIEEITR